MDSDQKITTKGRRSSRQGAGSSRDTQPPPTRTELPRTSGRAEGSRGALGRTLRTLQTHPECGCGEPGLPCPAAGHCLAAGLPSPPQPGLRGAAGAVGSGAPQPRPLQGDGPPSPPRPGTGPGATREPSQDGGSAAGRPAAEQTGRGASGPAGRPTSHGASVRLARHPRPLPRRPRGPAGVRQKTHTNHLQRHRLLRRHRPVTSPPQPPPLPPWA